MSSSAKMLEGSAVARISVEPARFTGITVCLSATSSGISSITAGSISNSSRLIEGTPYCLATKSVSSFSSRKPSLVICAPRRPPLRARLLARLAQLLRAEEVLLDEELPDPLVHRDSPDLRAAEPEPEPTLAQPAAQGIRCEPGQVIGAPGEGALPLAGARAELGAAGRLIDLLEARCARRRSTSRPRPVIVTHITAWISVPQATAVSGATPKRSSATFAARWKGPKKPGVEGTRDRHADRGEHGPGRRDLLPGGRKIDVERDEARDHRQRRSDQPDQRASRAGSRPGGSRRAAPRDPPGSGASSPARWSESALREGPQDEARGAQEGARARSAAARAPRTAAPRSGSSSSA